MNRSGSPDPKFVIAAANVNPLSDNFKRSRNLIFKTIETPRKNKLPRGPNQAAMTKPGLIRNIAKALLSKIPA